MPYARRKSPTSAPGSRASVSVEALLRQSAARSLHQLRVSGQRRSGQNFHGPREFDSRFPIGLRGQQPLRQPIARFAGTSIGSVESLPIVARRSERLARGCDVSLREQRPAQVHGDVGAQRNEIDVGGACRRIGLPQPLYGVSGLSELETRDANSKQRFGAEFRDGGGLGGMLERLSKRDFTVGPLVLQLLVKA